MRRLLLVAILLALPVTANAARLAVPDVLWKSPDDREVPDQVQDTTAAYVWFGTNGAVDSCYTVGQQFVPAVSPLYRLDLMMANYTDQRPAATIRIWKWVGPDNGTGHTQTTAPSNPVLFSETIDLSGAEYRQTRSFFPQPPINVEVGQKYYFEISDSGTRDTVLFYGNADGTDRYPSGLLWLNCAFHPANAALDLWFKTYSSPQGSAPVPVFQGSDPNPVWQDPDADASVTKTDYYNRVSNFENIVRNDGRFGCGVGARFDVLNEAFLYKASCSPGPCSTTYLTNTVDMFRRMYDWRFCDPSLVATVNNETCDEDGTGDVAACDPNEPAMMLERPGIGYWWIRNAPGIAQIDRDRIRNLLIDNGCRFWSQREAGTHNRAMNGALSYLLLTTLFTQTDFNNAIPALRALDYDHDGSIACDSDGNGSAQSYSAWSSYHQGVWNNFWSKKDTEEDSAGYNDEVWWQAVNEYAMIAGLDATVWPDPGFRALVDRFWQHTTPLGADFNYGQAGGFGGDSAGLIWLFEKAATKYSDTKYKWLAHRVFDFNRSHACDDPTTGTFDETYFNNLTPLCMAYLDANESIGDSAPPAQAEVLDARQDTNSSGLYGMQNGNPVGQTFTPSAKPLVRLDVKVRNNGDPTAGTITLWKWNTSGYAATIAQAPLYKDTINLSGADVLQDRSFYPFLSDITPGALYYVEFNRATPFSLAGTTGGTDLYTGGKLRFNNQEQNKKDLWFRTDTLSQNGSTYTTRLEAFPRPISQHGFPAQLFDMGTAKVPDKLVLRSGFTKNDLHAVFNLIVGPYGHGQYNAASLTSLVDDGSILHVETGSPYWDFDALQDQDETLPFYKRYWGGTVGTRGDRTRVTRMADYRKASVAWVEWDNAHTWTAAQERRFLFVKDRFLMVRDRFTFPQATKASVGNVWHAGDVHTESDASNPFDPFHASTWYDLYIREPLANVYKFKNPERYVLLWFLPRTGIGYEAAEYKDPAYTPCANTAACVNVTAVDPEECRYSPPFVAYQRKVTQAVANETVWLDTLLVPHGSAQLPGAVANDIDVLYDNGVDVAVQVIVPNGGVNETWTLVDNPDGMTIVTGGLNTDARYLITRSKPGFADYILAHDAKEVHVGSINKSWPVKTTVEIGGY